MSAAVSPDSKLLYIANTSRNQIHVWDTEKNEITSSIAVPASPRAMVHGPPPPRPTPSAATTEVN